MGCDIHMYVEYKSKYNKNWSSFGGRINPGRNYWMFGLIAKVRCKFNESLSPKGMPEDAGWKSSSDNQLIITETGEEYGCCTIINAERWVRSGCRFIDYNGKHSCVTHPDWHSHTWLNLFEFEQVMKNFNNKENAGREPEYEALLAAMQKLAEFDYDVRVICWFDN